MKVKKNADKTTFGFVEHIIKRQSFVNLCSTPVRVRWTFLPYLDDTYLDYAYFDDVLCCQSWCYDVVSYL